MLSIYQSFVISDPTVFIFLPHTESCCAEMIPRGSNRRGSHVIDTLRNSALGISRLSPFASRDFRANDRDGNIDEEGEDNPSHKSDSAMSMSSSSSGHDSMVDSKRRQSRAGGLTQSMVNLHLDGDKAARRSKYIIMGVLLVIALIILILTSVMLNQEEYKDFVNGVSYSVAIASFLSPCCGKANLSSHWHPKSLKTWHLNCYFESMSKPAPWKPLSEA
jgi:hypothetical protein